MEGGGKGDDEAGTIAVTFLVAADDLDEQAGFLFYTRWNTRLVGAARL